MTTSKSPLKIAQVAYAMAKQALPDYSNKFSPKKFTLAQLTAILVLKEFFSKDYRGISAIVADSSDIQKALELKTVPHFTTLQKTEQNLLKRKRFTKLLYWLLKLSSGKKLQPKQVALAAMDSTGLESRHISRYYVMRRHFSVKNGLQKAEYRRYPKAGILINTKNHLILSGIAERGPKFDLAHVDPLLKQAKAYVSIKALVADAGYDSEASHTLIRKHYGIRSIILPRIGRPTQKLPTGFYRRLMVLRFDKKSYGQRWQVETVHSMIKRLQGSFLRARSYWSQCREILLRLLTHNVMIIVSR
jgi:hypothetical protein